MPKRVNNNWLVFVDTNILLDFYRKDGADAVKQLDALSRHRDRMIMTGQVFMEFLKNRQVVIGASMGEIRRPEAHRFPPILRDLVTAQAIEKEITSTKMRVEKMIVKNLSILTDPKKNDQVYKSICAMFEASGQFHLRREMPLHRKMERLALKRFFLGNPPRKKDDTSVGDALNWEWIIHCASSCRSSSHVMIVSRDGDYGFRHKTQSYLNDWLLKEFKDRVGKERKIILTAKLTEALKLLSETVSKKEEQAEETLLESVGQPVASLADVEIWPVQDE